MIRLIGVAGGEIWWRKDDILGWVARDKSIKVYCKSEMEFDISLDPPNVASLSNLAGEM